MENSNNENKKSGGCLKLFLIGLGYLVLLSPLNPFIEWRNIGEDRELTNSSYVLVIALLLGYTWLLTTFFSDKK